MDTILNEKMLRKVQLRQLEVLKEVDRICKKNNIQYFLVGGTLLGAVRHGGFIPWDDDLDIGMERKEYDKFIEICSSQLDKKYFLQTQETDDNYWLPFAKIKINNTIFEEKCTQQVEMHKGIYIDIFPYDNIANLNMKNIGLISNIINLLTTSMGYRNKVVYIDKISTKIVIKLINILNKKTIIRIQTWIMKKDNHKQSKYITNFGSNYGYKKQTVKKEIYFPLKYIRFEDNEYPIPNNYEILLSRIYGDYKKLPPLEKRNSGHHIIHVDLGKDTEN